MKTEKMKIKNLKVKSFITNHATSEIKGGYASAPAECPSGLGKYTCNSIEMC